jgi:hypothetical protein
VSADFQRELSLAADRIGEVQIAQGRLAAALASYQAALAIIERLAKSVPVGSKTWQYRTTR